MTQQDNPSVSKPISAPYLFWSEVDAYAAQAGLSRAALVRLAVNEYIAKRTVSPTGLPA